MTVSYTQGPWRIGPYYRHEVVSDQGLICCGRIETEQSRANARLIAAAPELLEALQEIVDSADQSNGGKGAELPWSLHVREIAITAIRKAKVVNHLSPNKS